MKGLEGKVAVIAGGTGGIGEAICFQLAEQGVKVVVNSLNEADAQRVADTIGKAGGVAIAVAADISEEAAVRKLFESAVGKFGGVDLFAGNAAAITKEVHARDTDILETPLDIFDKTIAVNLRGLVLCSRQAIPLMLQRGGGSIVYTSSMAAATGTPISGAYAMSKAGVNALTRHVAARWGKEGIRSNAVSPGLVMTPTAHEFQEQKFIDDYLAEAAVPKVGDGSTIASVITFLLSGESDYLQGQVINLNGGKLMRD